MRAPGLSSLTILALVCLWQPCLAQDKPPEGSNGASPARIGTLSPDEARRAERARKRRAGSGPSTPAHAATTPPPAPAVPAPAQEAKRPPPPRPQGTREAQRPADTRPAAEQHPTKMHTKIAQAHRVRVVHAKSASRRRVAHNDDRDASPRSRPPRNRRLVMDGGARWTPKVGDVVPTGVPLYPLPPAYGGAAPAYGYAPERPAWGYAPAPAYGYPPTYGYGYADE